MANLVLSHSTTQEVVVLKTLVAIVFGVDMISGLFAYEALSAIFGKDFDGTFFLMAIFFAHAPDGDMIPFLLLRKRWGLLGHWAIAHHPIIVVPSGIATMWLIGGMFFPADQSYLSALTGACLLAHFLHDGFEEMGFHWLSPFAFRPFRMAINKPREWAHLYLREWPPRLLTQEEIGPIYDKFEQDLEYGGSSDEITSRAESPSLLQITLTLALLAIAAVWAA